MYIDLLHFRFIGSYQSSIICENIMHLMESILLSRQEDRKKTILNLNDKTLKELIIYTRKNVSFLPSKGITNVKIWMLKSNIEFFLPSTMFLCEILKVTMLHLM